MRALQKIKQQKACKIEQQHGGCIARPVLLLTLACSCQTIKSPFDGNEDRRQKRALAIENARHIAAKRLYERDDDPAKDEDLYPSIDCHGFSQA